MFGARQKGQNLVELALVMPILLWFALGILDFGRVFYFHMGLTNAAREGARCATLKVAPCNNVPTCNATNVANWMVSQPEQAALGITAAMISVDCSQADRRTVTISYPFEPVTVFIADALGDGSTIPLVTWATLPVVAQ